MDWVRETFVQSLDELGYDARGVGTLRDARRLVNPESWQRHPFDVLLVDLKLPDGESIPLIEVAVELDPWPVVVAITAFLDDAYALTFTRLGALYVPKPIGDKNLSELMDLVEQRRSDFPSRYARARRLSARETEALRHTLKGLTWEETSKEMGVGVSTIKTMWRRIFKKTGMTSQQKLVSDLIDHWTRESALGGPRHEGPGGSAPAMPTKS